MGVVQKCSDPQLCALVLSRREGILMAAYSVLFLFDRKVPIRVVNVSRWMSIYYELD